MRSFQSAIVLACIAGCGGAGISLNPNHLGGVDFAISNGVTWMMGSDAAATTTLAGNCAIIPNTGHIDCDGLVIRVATPGVFSGIGWQLIDPSSPTCSGSSQSAPKVAVFSFGTLVISPGATVSVSVPGEGFESPSLGVALVAADHIEVDGSVVASASALLNGLPMSLTDPILGPSPGGWVMPGAQAGASGAGGATVGGSGGSGGPPGGAAVMPQLDPMCPGSMGGWVASGTSVTGGEIQGVGGVGGGALLLAARAGIEIGATGSVAADARPGVASALGSPGPGGGSGGTVLLEAPSVAVANGGVVSAVGGKGGNGADGLGGAGGGGAPPGDGSAGTSAGGGGGAAGFIRVRTSSCGSFSSAFSPSPTCSTL